MNGAVVGFVATKPLQILTSILVARQLAPLRSSLTVVPTFAGADRIVANLARHETGFESVTSAPNRFAAIVSMRADDIVRVFVDSDVGIKTLVAMRLLRALNPHVRFSLYEEGIGLIEPGQISWPRAPYERLGVAMELGESHLIDDVWTYSPDAVHERLPSQALQRIDATISDFVRAERALLQGVFWEGYEADARGWGGALCHLYLSSWCIDRSTLAYLARSPGHRVLKPHPHIRHDVALAYGMDQVLAASIPAELVIVELAKAFETVVVLHHASSVASYVRAPNVRFVQVDEALASGVPVGLEHA